MRPSAFRPVLQITAFIRKESLEIIRQPRLLLTLVFGPFLIMAVFGLGYRDTPDPMKTIPCICASDANIARLALVLPVDAHATF